VPTLGTYDVFFLLEEIIDGLSDLLMRSAKPFLAYFHLYPPHDPYCPRREFVGAFDDGWAPAAKPQHVLSPHIDQAQLDRQRIEYDEYIAYVDAEFGRFLDFMHNSGLLENSYLVITSDHGEMFERGVYGHTTELLYDTVVRVPLLISAPGQQQRRDVYKNTSGVDLMPTLLHALGQPVPEWCEGVALPIGDLAGNDRALAHDRPIFSLEAKTNPSFAPLKTYTASLVRDRYKLIYYTGYEKLDDAYELYDMINDPEERENLYTPNQSIASELAFELRQTIKRNDW
jgi:arylsulfatase A-like enzyme